MMLKSKALQIYELKLIAVIDNVELFAQAYKNRKENCRIICQTLYSFTIATLFYKGNKKQEPCRQHSTMSLIEISKSIPQNLDYL